MNLRWWPALALFVWFAGDGLFSDLFPDEMMNIYRVWIEPWSELLRRLAIPWDGHTRPLGALLYRPLFDAFGFAPLPYRAICIALLIVNLWIAWRLALRLSDSPLTASLTALFFAYHAYLADLYYSSATIYELLCFACGFGALLLYVERRGHWIPILLLYFLALKSKEMAVTLPLLVLLTNAPHRLPTAAAGLSLAALVTFATTRGPDSLLSLGGYTPSLANAFANAGRYLGMLFYAQRDLRPAETAAVLLAAVVACALLRHRAAWIALAAILILPLPVLLIDPRSFYVFYLPYWGWCLLTALAISALTRRLPREWIVIAVCFMILIPLHQWRKPYGNAWVPAERVKVRRVVDELDAKLPALPASSRVLIEADPFDPGDWILTFLFRLRYRDQQLEVIRPKAGQFPGAVQATCVLSLENYRLDIRSGCR